MKDYGVKLVLNEIKKYALDNNVPIMLDDGIEFLCNLIKEKKVKTILEIGTAIGYSSIKMALVDNDISVTTIERDIDRYNIALKNIKKTNLDE
ncbi:MAG: SAM-dependent methyltransferase, partial [Firmicutes bacterium]|nr:SAM-dependent methyltransferase [Bacillota bacterium]